VSACEYGCVHDNGRVLPYTMRPSGERGLASFYVVEGKKGENMNFALLSCVSHDVHETPAMSILPKSRT
jgi:hypothetical protein